MIAFLKLASVLAATVTSFLGIWQAATILEINPFLTLPLPGHDYVRALFDVGGLLPNTDSFASSEETRVGSTRQISKTVAGIVTPASTIHDPIFTATFPTPVVADTNSSFVTELPAGGDTILPEAEEEGKEKVTTFAKPISGSLESVVDFLFSLVQERPSSAMETVQFALAAVFILGIVGTAATALFWGLWLINLRGLVSPPAAEVRSNITTTTTDTAVLHAESQNLDIASAISDMMQSVVGGAFASSAAGSSSVSLATDLAYEILAYATEVAGSRCDALAARLGAEILGLGVETLDLKSKLEQLEANNTTARQETDVVGHRCDALAVRLGAEIRFLRTRHEQLETEVRSDTLAARLGGEVSDLRSKFKQLEANLTTQRLENESLLSRLNGQQKKHEALVIGLTSVFDKEKKHLYQQLELQELRHKQEQQKPPVVLRDNYTSMAVADPAPPPPPPPPAAAAPATAPAAATAPSSPPRPSTPAPTVSVRPERKAPTLMASAHAPTASPVEETVGTSSSTSFGGSGGSSNNKNGTGNTLGNSRWAIDDNSPSPAAIALSVAAPVFRPGHGVGPGPNGGKRGRTSGNTAHNSRQGIRHSINKALRSFTEQERQHAYACQDKATLTFPLDSAWAWLNPLTDGVGVSVQMPSGWKSPFFPGRGEQEKGREGDKISGA